MNDTISLLTYAITIYKSELSTNFIELDRIKSAVTDVTNETDLIISQFPQFIVIAAPTSQITVAIQPGGISISNGSTEISNASAKQLANLARKINDIAKERLSNYVYTIGCVLELPKARDLTAYLNADKLLESGLIDDKNKLDYAALTWAEGSDSGRSTVSITPKLDSDYNHTTQFDMQRMVRVKSQSLPPITKLSQELMKHYKDCAEIRKKLSKR